MSLDQLRTALADAAASRERARAAAAQREREAAADTETFQRAVGPVTPLRVAPRAVLPAQAPLPLPLQTQRDEQAVMREALSDEFDPESLLDADDALWYARAGVSRDVVRKLRRGTWVVQEQIDLHGLRRHEARDALADFLRESVKRGLRCVRVIHGKGLGSVNREPVLKGKVRAWLTQKAEVMAFCEARANDGGSGAVLVLLQAGRSGS
jgi:DNA-nicking Smr family endonuclease